MSGGRRRGASDARVFASATSGFERAAGGSENLRRGVRGGRRRLKKRKNSLGALLKGEHISLSISVLQLDTLSFSPPKSRLLVLTEKSNKRLRLHKLKVCALCGLKNQKGGKGMGNR